MRKIKNIEIENALLLAPMEDITGIAFRRICKEFGADIVYTEFVNSDGLIRKNKKTAGKMKITDTERPVGIQIYGSDIQTMVEAAQMAEEEEPDIIDINAGCWVKKVAKRGAGAGLLKDPVYMQEMVKKVVDSVKLPVTVKTRLGWDEENIKILEVAKRMEDAGAVELTLHCRTRTQAHNGIADWDWIRKVKEVVDIPVVLNGGVFSAEDAKHAFEQTGADGIMIARGAIGVPWIFLQTKELLETGIIKTEADARFRISTALKHFRYELEVKELRSVIFPFRKYWAGYLKGLYCASKIKQELMKLEEYEPIEDLLMNYVVELEKYDQEKGNL